MCVTSDLFTVCGFLGKKVVHDAKPGFVCGGKENCFGVALSLVTFLYFFFCIYGGNGIAYDSSNKPRFSGCVRNGRAHAE